MTSILRAAARALGYDIVAFPDKPVSRSRALGGMERFLGDLARRGLKVERALDVGANSAWWSRTAAQVFPKAQFTLIEPQEEMRDSLKAFCDKQPGSAYYIVAAGSQDTELSMTIWPDRQGTSLLPDEAQAASEGLARRIVPVRRLDEFLRQENRGLPDLVKLDVQGFELEALRGAGPVLGTAEVIILEVATFTLTAGMPDLAEVVRFMDEAGYKLYDFCGFLPRPYDGALAQTDMAFARKDGFLRAYSRWS